MSNKKLEQELYKLAEKSIVAIEGRGDLETHKTNEEDFFDISIWELKDALIAAYELGKSGN